MNVLQKSGEERTNYLKYKAFVPSCQVAPAIGYCHRCYSKAHNIRERIEFPPKQGLFVAPSCYFAIRDVEHQCQYQEC